MTVLHFVNDFSMVGFICQEDIVPLRSFANYGVTIRERPLNDSFHYQWNIVPSSIWCQSAEFHLMSIQLIVFIIRWTLCLVPFDVKVPSSIWCQYNCEWLCYISWLTSQWLFHCQNYWLVNSVLVLWVLVSCIGLIKPRHYCCCHLAANQGATQGVWKF